jgi:phospholipid/cholesterol/gamma-HCH transport system permease protein
MNAFVSYLNRLGEVILNGFSGIGRVIFLFFEVVGWGLRGRMEWKILVQQLHFIGVQSLPVVLTTGAFTGMVMCYASYPQFARLSVTSWIGPLVAKGLTQELGPVLAGLMLAGRVGCAMAAELGYMNVSEQIDALKTMGTNPVRYLVLPRVVAFTLMTPLLTFFAIGIGVAGGMLLTIYGLGVEYSHLIDMTKQWMIPYDYLRAVVKGFAFGLTNALVCCYMGLNARGGAEGVGRATTDANVYACVTVLVVNMYLTMVLSVWDPQYT